MSVKINKNDKEYPLGFVPQSLYDDVEELKEAVFRGSKSVTADGVKTYKALLNELYSIADISKINFNSHIRIANDVYAFDGFLRFSRARTDNNNFNNTSIIFNDVSSAVYSYSGTLPISDISNSQPPQGIIISIHY